MPITKPAIVTEEHLKFLDALRKSGVTNMFGSPVYVQQEFEISKKEAFTIVEYWMKSFGDRHKNGA